MRIRSHAKFLFPIFMACASAVHSAPAEAAKTAAPAATPAKAPAVQSAPAATAAAPAPAVAAPAAPAGAPSVMAKSCDDLKASLEAKLKAKGVKTFTLEIVPKEKVGNAKVIGNCQAGSQQITYSKG